MKNKPSRLFKKRRNQPGLHQIPGSLAYVGQKTLDTSVDTIQYSPDNFAQLSSDNIKTISRQASPGLITWHNIIGLNDTAAIKEVGDLFTIHPLILESLVNTGHRPKLEEYESSIFLTLKMLYYDEKRELISEHFGLILIKNAVLTFQEIETGLFDNLKKRIELSKGRVRNAEADYLAFSIVDAIVDDYFMVAESIAEKAEMLEDELFRENPDQDIAEEIQKLKHEIMQIKKSVQPLKEMIRQLEKTDHPLITKPTRKYFRNLNSHIAQVNESIDIYREIIWSLMEIYLATINNKMNEVMKMLTIMASIFIPLTFVAGVYGMNFTYMPELEWKYAYFAVLVLMLGITMGMLWYFRRKRWF